MVYVKRHTGAGFASARCTKVAVPFKRLIAYGPPLCGLKKIMPQIFRSPPARMLPDLICLVLALDAFMLVLNLSVSNFDMAAANYPNAVLEILRGSHTPPHP
jgi:hypothetical protein